MSTYVHDGILLGIILPETKDPQIIFGKEDEAIQQIDNLVKLEAIDENAKGVCFSNHGNTDAYYVGIFWEWSSRQILSIDGLWQPLFMEHSESAEKLNQGKNQHLQKRVFETLQNYVPSLKLENIRFYEVRYFS